MGPKSSKFIMNNMSDVYVQNKIREVLKGKDGRDVQLPPVPTEDQGLPLYTSVLHMFNVSRALELQANRVETPELLPMTDSIIGALTSAAKFKVDNIAAWAYLNVIPKQGEKAFLTDMIGKLPNCAPVAESMWFEYATVRAQRERRDQIIDASLQGTLMMIIADREKPGGPKIIEGMAIKYEFQDSATKSRWFIAVFEFLYSVDAKRPGVWSPDFIKVIGVSGDGKLQGMFSTPNPYVAQPDVTYYNKVSDEAMVALSSLCFLHVRNVTTQEHRPNRAAVRRLERAGEPVLSHKTVSLFVPKSREQYEREKKVGEPYDGVMPFHLVMGGFAEYTEEKPLFGRPGPKNVGLVYRPAHARGNPVHGRVDKDYELKTKGEEGE